MLKRTKIIATLGPSTDKQGMLHRLVESGVDLVRVNLSHGKRDSHKERIEATRACAAALGKAVSIIIDLQGPTRRRNRVC